MSIPLTSESGPQPAWEIARLFPPDGAWSVSDYLYLTDDTNQLVEFVDGRVEVLEMPTTAHQRILSFLYAALREFVMDRRLGEVLFAPLRIQVGETRFREPDILFAKKDKRNLIQNRYWLGADLVVEIVSEDSESRERDFVTKKADYAAAGIPEYWIVDPLEKRITVLTLDSSKYALHGEFTPDQRATSRLLDGFAVEVAAVFQAAIG
jgi:Uma2 family endonuclease